MSVLRWQSAGMFGTYGADDVRSVLVSPVLHGGKVKINVSYRLSGPLVYSTESESAICGLQPIQIILTLASASETDAQVRARTIAAMGGNLVTYIADNQDPANHSLYFGPAPTRVVGHLVSNGSAEVAGSTRTVEISAQFDAPNPTEGCVVWAVYYLHEPATVVSDVPYVEEIVASGVLEK